MAAIGKIARMPEAIRTEVCKRLRDGQLGPQILPWINTHPEARAILNEWFHGADVSPQNLSDFRNGQYKQWEEKQDRHFERLERTRDLAGAAAKLAQASGGNLAEGAAAILGGSILEVLEELETVRNITTGAPPDPEKTKALCQAIDTMTNAVARLRRGDQDNVVLKQNQRRLEQKDQELHQAERKWQRDTCSLFIQWYEDQRARDIAAAPGDNSTRIERLGQLMFGQDWAAPADAQP